MKAQIITTITTTIDIETMDMQHDAHIEATEPLPQEVVGAIAAGACQSLINELNATHGGTREKPEPTTGDAEF
jgi:hypothetical protein